MKALSLDTLIGKPIVVYKDGKRREVGTIVSAIFHDDAIEIRGGITDEPLRDLLRHEARKGLSIGG